MAGDLPSSKIQAKIKKVLALKVDNLFIFLLPVFRQIGRHCARCLIRSNLSDLQSGDWEYFIQSPQSVEFNIPNSTLSVIFSHGDKFRIIFSN